MALRQFTSNDNDTRHASLDPGAPAKLARSSDHHYELFSSLRLHCKRYDIPLIGEIYSLLSYYRSLGTFRASPSAAAISARTLMHYRWCRGGTGIISLRGEDAELEWEYSVSPDEKIWQAQSESSKHVLQAAITDLCAPDARICRNGYFDLSILIE
ncbi:hypothetical protein AbraIFM66951_006679 [Aspergillus brasiliensis]|uniref:Uncharacterized protein n=1 Tax=Aspergillus brasiliensis TaxID=319629 RepID=A0A9W5YSR5_9EURO|nr:hypothetical protein AbraCBS73388_007392 [Aspergillus brasiliensis]GKZ44475.1 hypothetical protein AbraIFM66951_006679 [Aspergillus brasiliensis]